MEEQKDIYCGSCMKKIRPRKEGDCPFERCDECKERYG
jgi:hypothetical protein